MNVMFKVKSSETLHYEWFVVGDGIDINDECYSGTDSNTLTIQHFENIHVGMYTCVISTATLPTVSLSAKSKLELEG